MSDNPIIKDALTAWTSAAYTASANLSGKSLYPSKLSKYVVRVSAVSGTNPTLDISFEESSDDSSYTDIAGGTVGDQITATGDYNFYFISTSQYVRPVIVIGGTSTPTFTFEIIPTTTP